MATQRLDRKQFYAALAALDDDDVRKALWSLYWRGSASLQERIMTVIDPPSPPEKAARARADVDAEALLREVTEFASLARHGAYLAGDRRVSPKERTRWRFTFQRLAKTAAQALGGREVEPAASALSILIDLACESRSVDYFRSEDPVEAARFVVSEAASLLWAAIRREHGHAAFCERAAGDLLRWEARWGWTRYGDGWVSAREVPLAQVVAGMLPAADAWGEFADHYLAALDAVAGPKPTEGRASRLRRVEKGELEVWHQMLRERLAHGEYEDRIDLITRHPAFTRGR